MRKRDCFDRNLVLPKSNEKTSPRKPYTNREKIPRELSYHEGHLRVKQKMLYFSILKMSCLNLFFFFFCMVEVKGYLEDLWLLYLYKHEWGKGLSDVSGVLIVLIFVWFSARVLMPSSYFHQLLNLLLMHKYCCIIFVSNHLKVQW